MVASLPNEMSARVLRAPGAGVRLFAPAMRNVLDREFPVSRFAASIDVLCCNRIEWETLEDREEVALAALDSGRDRRAARKHGAATPAPAAIPGCCEVEAFPQESSAPRHQPGGRGLRGHVHCVRCSTQGWDAGSGVVEDEMVRAAARRASAAAALVLDRVEFGFPSANEIDEASARGGCRDVPRDQSRFGADRLNFGFFASLLPFPATCARPSCRFRRRRSGCRCGGLLR